MKIFDRLLSRSTKTALPMTKLNIPMPSGVKPPLPSIEDALVLLRRSRSVLVTCCAEPPPPSVSPQAKLNVLTNLISEIDAFAKACDPDRPAIS